MYIYLTYLCIYVYEHVYICVYIVLFRSDLGLYIWQGGDDVADV